MRKEEEEEEGGEVAAAAAEAKAKETKFNERTTKRTYSILNFQKRQMTALAYVRLMRIQCDVYFPCSLYGYLRVVDGGTYAILDNLKNHTYRHANVRCTRMVCDLKNRTERWKRDSQPRRMQ